MVSSLFRCLGLHGLHIVNMCQFHLGAESSCCTVAHMGLPFLKIFCVCNYFPLFITHYVSLPLLSLGWFVCFSLNNSARGLCSRVVCGFTNNPQYFCSFY